MCFAATWSQPILLFHIVSRTIILYRSLLCTCCRLWRAVALEVAKRQNEKHLGPGKRHLWSDWMSACLGAVGLRENLQKYY